ncbi:hypothetical protein ACSV5N_11125 [Agrobacterium salinitolerans]|uniref:hypothetical protein n=1 Tax=Agrobacterium salinitolerans TaxID=1183413 RepID=UPI00098F9C8A|nr:hypothetical protein [Agrobacterium salinitolerans]OOO20455.1 hypothetical protein BS627_14825 [Agrobacterium salinitolerans]PNQ22860.1 hypothetical protein C2E26_15095 [Rhizobium sp. YIC5082]
MTQDLDTFGRLLMKDVRDQTILEYDGMVSGKINSISGKKLRALLDQFDQDQREAIKSIILTQIDGAIHNFLWLIEKGGDSSFPVVLNGGIPPVDLATASDGLTGELYSDEGWIARYSMNRGTFS